MKNVKETKSPYVPSVPLILFVCLVVVILLAVLSTGVTSLEYRFKMHADVLNFSENNITKLGVSVDSDKLEFGIVPIGGNVTKVVEIESSSKNPAKAIITIDGNITPYIETEREVYMEGGERLKLYVKFVGSEEGNYTGIMKIKLFVAKYKFMGNLLKYYGKSG